MRGLAAIMLLVFSLLPVAVQAQGLSIIRDTEIEATLESWAEPVLKAADLTPEQVRIILVDSDSVNAFVAGGANIFIYSGLIEKADYPEEVTGVIAHEIGHIAGGHLIANRRAIQRATYQSILATALGIGAAILTGESQAAAAVTMGGSGLAHGGFLGHSRAQESAADQSALKFFEKAEMNPQGLVSFLRKLEGEELLPAARQSEYMRTHPLTRDRISAMAAGADQSPHSAPLGQSAHQQEFDYVRAKLRAFRKPHMVPRYYNHESGEAIDIYAHAIRLYRQKDYDGALTLFDRLLAMQPENPYFHELRAQTLRDAGRLAEAEQGYKKALSLLDDAQAPLIKVALAHVMIEQQKSGEEIERLLLSSLQEDPHETRVYRLMATMRGRQGKEADAQYFLAEEAAAMGNRREARRLLELATRSDALSDDLEYRATDLKTYLESLPQGLN